MCRCIGNEQRKPPTTGERGAHRVEIGRHLSGDASPAQHFREGVTRECRVAANEGARRIGEPPEQRNLACSGGCGQLQIDGELGAHARGALYRERAPHENHELS